MLATAKGLLRTGSARARAALAPLASRAGRAWGCSAQRWYGNIKTPPKHGATVSDHLTRRAGRGTPAPPRPGDWPALAAFVQAGVADMAPHNDVFDVVRDGDKVRCGRAPREGAACQAAIPLCRRQRRLFGAVCVCLRFAPTQVTIAVGERGQFELSWAAAEGIVTLRYVRVQWGNYPRILTDPRSPASHGCALCIMRVCVWTRSPLRGEFKYTYDWGREAWLCLADGHLLLDLLTRDLIYCCNGFPKF